MDSKKLIACVGRLAPTQAIHLTFPKTQDGIHGLNKFMNICEENRNIRCGDLGSRGVVSIIQKSNWGNNVDRTFCVWGLKHSTPVDLERLAPYIESVSTSPHFASAIFGGSEPKRKTAAVEIVRAVANRSLIDELSSYGCFIAAGLYELDSLPVIHFAIKNTGDQQEIARVTLDGFSGTLAVDGKWLTDRRFSDAESVRQRIYSAMTDALDKLTESSISPSVQTQTAAAEATMGG